MAGPMARETLIAMLFSATAGCSWSADTRSGTIADHAGNIRALPSPRAKTNPMSTQAVVRSSSVMTPSRPATTIR